MSARRTRIISRFNGWWHTYLPWRYTILFYSLLLTLAVGPLHSALGFDVNLLELFLAINLLAAVVPIVGRQTRRVLLTILVIAFIGRGGTAWFEQVALVSMNLLLWTVVALLAAANALHFSLSARVVDRERLYAGLSAYLLAGFFFGVFYWVFERTWPGSFALASQLYLAVMIARLVSLYVSRESKGNHHDAQDSPERSFKAGEET